MPPTITPAQRERIRAQFPALAASTIFLENAGGSQVPRQVAERMRDYLLNTYVQLGAGYPLSQQCTELVDEAHLSVQLLMNGQNGHVILGSSTTALLHMLAECYRPLLAPGSEIILAETGHEANLGPWKQLAAHGATLKWWRMNPETCSCSLEDLAALLTEKTLLVAFPHASNLLGEIVDVAAITRLAHDAGARVVVDGVAYAPHRAMDCAAWDVDWYAFSLYKVYGPHMAALYGRVDAVAELEGPNHFFIPREEIPYKFELGGVSHEGCAGILGITEYMRDLAGLPQTAGPDRAALVRAGEMMTACEEPLQAKLLSYLRDKPGIQIVGPQETGPNRVGTVSFVHESLSSSQITEVVDKSGVAIRHGHMYAYHLCEALGLDPEDGVVRVSFVHYNAEEEIDRLIEVLEAALSPA